MDWLIERYIAELKKKSNGSGVINPSNVPKPLIEIAQNLLSDCTARLIGNKGLTLQVSNAVALLPEVLRGYHRNLPLRPQDIDAIGTVAAGLSAITYLQTGKLLIEDPRYTVPVLALYQPTEMATVEQLEAKLKHPIWMPGE